MLKKGSDLFLLFTDEKGMFFSIINLIKMKRAQ